MKSLKKIRLPLLDWGPGKDVIESNAKKIRAKQAKPTTTLALIDNRVTHVSNLAAVSAEGEGAPTTGLLAPPKTKRYRLNDFHIVTTIGNGAFSTVNLARHIFGKPASKQAGQQTSMRHTCACSFVRSIPSEALLSIPVRLCLSS